MAEVTVSTGKSKDTFQKFPFSELNKKEMFFLPDLELLRGSGYLGYVDSNQGYNPYKWVICPLTRVISLHNQLLSILNWS